MSLYSYWPLALIVIMNVIYNISAKATSPKIHPFASLIITYAISIVICFIMLAISGDYLSIATELHKVNYSAFTLSIAVTFLEFGYLLLYKFGWDISIGSLVSNIICSVALLAVGIAFYGDLITIKIAIGIVMCFVGLVLINKKSTE